MSWEYIKFRMWLHKLKHRGREWRPWTEIQQLQSRIKELEEEKNQWELRATLLLKGRKPTKADVELAANEIIKHLQKENDKLQQENERLKEEKVKLLTDVNRATDEMILGNHKDAYKILGEILDHHNTKTDI